jgi:hypothetical protein
LHRTVGLGINSIANLWLAAPEVPFKGIDGLAGVTSYYRTFLRGDIKITQFLRDAALAQDSAAHERLQVFSTIFLAVAHHNVQQAIQFSATQIRRISEEVGPDVTVGHEAFLDAIGSSPLELFDTSVWSQRRIF